MRGESPPSKVIVQSDEFTSVSDISSCNKVFYTSRSSKKLQNENILFDLSPMCKLALILTLTTLLTLSAIISAYFVYIKYTVRNGFDTSKQSFEINDQMQEGYLRGQLSSEPPSTKFVHASNSITTFTITGGLFQLDRDIIGNEKAITPHGLSSVSIRNETFLVHLGDFTNASFVNGCDEIRYRQFRHHFIDYFDIPVFVLPGKNDYVSCPDANQAQKNWQKFTNMNDKSIYNFSFLSRVSRENEKFAFHMNSILYIGLDLITKDDSMDWSDQIDQNLNFLDKHIKMNKNVIKGIVVFGNEKGEEQKQSLFWQSFTNTTRDLDIPCLFINGHDYIRHFKFTNGNVKEPGVLTIKLASIPFMTVMIDSSVTPVAIKFTQG